ncbi:MAG: tetratricopeptide repeat protein [Phycisphaerales bacterium]|nr:tetratricopeptide repeat protein [Phycisphaerales bacterium]
MTDAPETAFAFDDALVDPKPPRTRIAAVAIALTIIVAALVAYIPAMQAGYIWDDDDYVTENRAVQSPTGLTEIWSFYHDPATDKIVPHTPQYYPFVFTTFWIEHQLWGLNPVGYHIVNIAIHIASALLVWRIARRIGIPAAWFIGAVFALHPVHVESVAWITERKNVLSGLFYLLSMSAMLRFWDMRGGRSWRRWGWWGVYGLSFLLFIAALLSKSVTCTLPAVLLLIHLYRGTWLSRRTVAVAVQMIPFFVIGIAAGLMTAHIEVAKVGATGQEWDYSLFTRTLIIAPTAYAFDAMKIAWPNPLIFIYPRWDIAPGQWMSYIPFTVLVGVLVAFIVLWRRIGRGPALLMLFGAGTLFPALGFVNVYPHRFSWVADHFQYLGSLGFIILFTVIVWWVMTRLLPMQTARRVGVVVAIIVLAILASLTFSHARDFKDKETLWRATLDANSEAWIAAINLGIEYREAGRVDEAMALFKQAESHPWARAQALNNQGLIFAEQEEYAQAVPLFQAAIEADPEHGRAYRSLGGALEKLSRLDEAGDALVSAVKYLPRSLPTRHMLARVRFAQGRHADAADVFETIIEVEEDDELAQAGLGEVLLRLDRFDEAVEHCRRAMELNPARLSKYRAIADQLVQRGRVDDAVAYYKIAAAIGPANLNAHQVLVQVQQFRQRDYAGALTSCNEALDYFPDDPSLLLQLAWLRATCPVDSLRDGNEAVGIASLLRDRLGDQPNVLDTLAAAYAEIGDFEEAARVASQAIEAATAARNGRLVQQIAARLDLYREGKPYRMPAAVPRESGG